MPLCVVGSELARIQVPIDNSHSTTRGGNWVDLIAGSTGSALSAVRPLNLHIAPVVVLLTQLGGGALAQRRNASILRVLNFLTSRVW
jgi:hypothetical protein